MEKNVLEKRIEERAEDRFNKELKELVNFIYKHPIGKRLVVGLGDKDIPIVNFGCNYGLLNDDGVKNNNVDKTNLIKVRSELIDQYKKEETDELLNKLDSIGYLFENC